MNNGNSFYLTETPQNATQTKLKYRQFLIYLNASKTHHETRTISYNASIICATHTMLALNSNKGIN
jgi:hypothetical protein